VVRHDCAPRLGNVTSPDGALSLAASQSRARRSGRNGTCCRKTTGKTYRRRGAGDLSETLRPARCVVQPNIRVTWIKIRLDSSASGHTGRRRFHLCEERPEGRGRRAGAQLLRCAGEDVAVKDLVPLAP